MKRHYIYIYISIDRYSGVSFIYRHLYIRCFIYILGQALGRRRAQSQKEDGSPALQAAREGILPERDFTRVTGRKLPAYLPCGLQETQRRNSVLKGLYWNSWTGATYPKD